jgi:antitoxin component of MazEF toxin-antitoxin module
MHFFLKMQLFIKKWGNSKGILGISLLVVGDLQYETGN